MVYYKRYIESSCASLIRIEERKQSNVPIMPQKNLSAVISITHCMPYDRAVFYFISAPAILKPQGLRPTGSSLHLRKGSHTSIRSKVNV